jgi:ATP/maltotriose-dependent transcriptional regulator MalT
LLSPRELEILRLVARGDRNRAIAGRLRVAESTVKSHLARINGKLGVSARTAAVTAALGQGLLRLDA